MFSIKEAAERSGLSPNAIRDYERRGLISAPRMDNGYRVYEDEHINRLLFIRRARTADFSLAQIGELLELRDDPKRNNQAVRLLAGQHLKEIRSKIRDLQHAEAALQQLYIDCLNDGTSGCAIIDGLEGRQ